MANANTDFLFNANRMKFDLQLVTFATATLYSATSRLSSVRGWVFGNISCTGTLSATKNGTIVQCASSQAGDAPNGQFYLLIMGW